MLSGISGYNNIYTQQAAINNYRLSQALSKHYGNMPVSGGKVPSVPSVGYDSLKDSMSYVNEYSSTMTDLMGSANALRPTASSGLSKNLEVSSSDSDVASAKVNYTVRNAGSYELDVTQLAAKQVNVSEGADSLAFAEKDLTMNIDSLKGSANISVSALNEDGSKKTNRQLLSDAASQINNANAGVKASVITKDGKSSLQISSVNTGSGSAFSVSGEYAKESGLDKVSQEAQNALYSVTKDGVTTSYKSDKNDISLDLGRIGVTLKKEGTATISADVNQDKIVDAVQDIVDNYNKTIDLLVKNTDRGPGAMRQLSTLKNIPGSDYERERLGLSFDKDGNLTLDKDTLRKNLKESPKSTQDLISGSFGLAQRAFNNASRAMTSPVSSLIGNDLNQANYSNSVSATNYMSSFSRSGAYNMSNYYAVGLMFNMMV